MRDPQNKNECRTGPAPVGHFHFKDNDLTTEVRSCMSYSHADGTHEFNYSVYFMRTLANHCTRENFS